MHAWPSPHREGSPVTVRTVTGGHIRWASTAIVVADDDDVIAFCQLNRAANKVTAAAAAPWPNRRERELALRRELLAGRFDLVDKVPNSPVMTVTVGRPGDWFSTRLVPDDRGSFVPQYVNIERPRCRTRVGYDADDLCLDIVIAKGSDGRLGWQLKDDGDVDERHHAGIYTSVEVSEIRRAARQAINRIEAREPPFDGSWANWRPNPDWRFPERLPDDWDDCLG